MKMTRVLLLMVVGTAAAQLMAQTVQFITVTRQKQEVQTDASSLSSDPTTPYLFSAEVNGNNAMTGSVPLTGASVTYPSTSSQGLTFDSVGHSWKYESAASDLTTLTTNFPDGTYTMSLTGASGYTSYTGTTNISLTNVSTNILNAPLMTLSGGSWGSGVYTIDPSQALTINFNSVFQGTPLSTDSFHYDVGVIGSTNVNITGTTQDFINYNPTTSSSANSSIGPLTINAGQFQSGQTYTLEVTYDQVQSFTLGALGAQASAGLVGVRTDITIMTPIPEPSTYALIGGLVVLAGVMLYRRRPLMA